MHHNIYGGKLIILNVADYYQTNELTQRNYLYNEQR